MDNSDFLLKVLTGDSKGRAFYAVRQPGETRVGGEYGRRQIEAECGKRQVLLVGYTVEGCPRLKVITALIAEVAGGPQSLGASCLKS